MSNYCAFLYIKSVTIVSYSQKKMNRINPCDVRILVNDLSISYVVSNTQPETLLSCCGNVILDQKPISSMGDYI